MLNSSGVLSFVACKSHPFPLCYRCVTDGVTWACGAADGLLGSDQRFLIWAPWISGKGPQISTKIKCKKIHSVTCTNFDPRAKVPITDTSWLPNALRSLPHLICLSVSPRRPLLGWFSTLSEPSNNLLCLFTTQIPGPCPQSPDILYKLPRWFRWSSPHVWSNPPVHCKISFWIGWSNHHFPGSGRHGLLNCPFITRLGGATLCQLFQSYFPGFMCMNAFKWVTPLPEPQPTCV